MTNDVHGKRAMQQCNRHLDMLGVDNKVKQLVYMYMETIYRDAYAKGQADAKTAMISPPLNQSH
ncbi:hypothetical protein EV213_12019 [Aureibacillus halotolerans]|uniref:Uncharacterized protein n=2 Tax=Aureibacillus halotolerans TaxID=1508390 RepID=A0A4R6TRA2_9BACI|nr:hypothetical protein EV213_12019 [Aureibacillus halotolerans]